MIHKQCWAAILLIAGCGRSALAPFGRPAVPSQGGYTTAQAGNDHFEMNGVGGAGGARQDAQAAPQTDVASRTDLAPQTDVATRTDLAPQAYRWTAVPSDASVLGTEKLRGPDFQLVWSADPSQVWIIGTAYCDCYSPPGPTSQIWRWENDTWRKGPDTYAWVKMLSGVSKSDLWIGGDNPVSVPVSPAHWNGTQYVGSDAPGGLLVWENSQSDIWVCCQNADEPKVARWPWTAISHWDGKTWKQYSLPAPGSGLLWSRSASEARLVGWNGLVLRFDGDAWTSEPFPVASLDAAAVWSTLGDDVWILSKANEVYRWNGSWKQGPAIQMPDGVALRGGWGAAPDNVWVVGTKGTIFHWDGKTWTREESGTEQDLNAVWGLRSGYLWVVGNSKYFAHRRF